MNSKGTRAPGNHPSDATEPGLERRPRTRQPLLWAALAYAIGIVAGSHAWRPPLWLLIAIIGFSVFGAYFLRRRPRAAFALGLAALLVAGALAIQIRPSNTSDTGVLSFADGRDLLITAHVAKEGTLREETANETQQRLDLETEEISTGDNHFPVTLAFASAFTGANPGLSP